MKRQKAQNNNLIENIIHGVFLIMGLITVGCVLLITVYLVISGIPAIREIGLREFLLGKVWASTAAEPKYGILPFILTMRSSALIPALLCCPTPPRVPARARPSTRCAMLPPASRRHIPS